MSQNAKTMMVLGGSGFIGQRVIAEATKSGWQVKALARSTASAAIVTIAGASVVRGDAEHSAEWLSEAQTASVIIDLIQPTRPKRVGRRQMRQISQQRQVFTRALVTALLTLSKEHRPRLISVSGIDDLAPDPQGVISANSTLRATPLGFNTIGIPVRKIIQGAAIDASFVYLGTVYGSGGPFGDTILPAVAAGKWKNFGGSDDRMVMVHVDDVARGLVRVAGLDQARAIGRSIVLTDNQPVTMAAFCELASKLMGVAAPGTVPMWLAMLVAGRPIVETTLRKETTRSTFNDWSDGKLIYSTYREGLPATLKTMGYPGAL